jgi:hypothetical protein
MLDRRQKELIKMLRMYTHLLHLNKPTIQTHKQYNLDALIKLQMQLFKKMKK